MMMRRILKTIALAFAAGFFCACNDDVARIKSGDYHIPKEIVEDFKSRNPTAFINDQYGYDDDNFVCIKFSEKNAKECVTVYSNHKWAATEKKYAINDAMEFLPRAVKEQILKMTNIGTWESNDFVKIVSRNGIENKLYEIRITLPCNDNSKSSYSFAFSEDGTELNKCSLVDIRSENHQRFCRMLEWIAEKYPNASILGVNYSFQECIYIRDNGILKKIDIKTFYNDEFKWEETTHPLNLNEPLPPSVIAYIEAYKEKYPDRPLTELYMSEKESGLYYKMAFQMSERSWAVEYLAVTPGEQD